MSRKEAGNIQAKLGAIQNRRGRRIFVVETLETVVVNGHYFLAQLAFWTNIQIVHYREF